VNGRTRSLGFAGFALAVSVLGLWRCHSQEAAAPRTEPETLPLAGDEHAAPAAAPTVAAGHVEPTAHAVPSAAPAEQDDTGVVAAPEPFGTTDNTLNALRAQSDAHDRALYSDIERQLHRDVPPEVRRLVAQKKGGASRDELALEVKKGKHDLRMRQLLAQWLDASFGTESAKVGPVPAGSGSGGAPLVKSLGRP
jgi:hypothetical protein